MLFLGKPLAKFCDIVGKILGVLTVALIAFLYLNNKFQFITDTAQIANLRIIKEYMVLATVIIVGLEFSARRNILFFILFCALAAVAVVFSFFPGAIPTFLQ